MLNMPTNRKIIKPYVGKDDPCTPLKEKTYETPPHLYLGIQQPEMEQYSLKDALHNGTLWPALYGPYSNPFKDVEDHTKKAESKKTKRR
jgi:spore coat protein JA